MNSLAPTLSNLLWPTSQSSTTRNVVLAILGSAIVALASQVNVPLQPVPFTLQTLAVLAIGAAFGSRLGAATLALYAVEGAIGLPVFAEFKSGLPVLFGPTGGYILGFIFAAGLVGWFAERGFDRSMPKMLLASLLGGAVLYIPGLLWLAGFVGGMDKAFEFGFAPFWLGDVIKAAIAALSFSAIWAVLGRTR